MIWDIRDSLGYDDFGNHPDLLAAKDKQDIEAGRYTRVSHMASCKCGYLMHQHPQVQGALWLRRTCEGILVKL